MLLTSAPARSRLPALVLAVVATGFSSACDDSFAPIEPNDLQFSVFGYLDASADTQWIRVMPIRPLVPTSPDPLGATVTLQQVGTDRVVELRDSVFRFELNNPEVGPGTVYVHNFWTTEPIRPGETYRFTVTKGAETPSEAVIAIPQEYDVEVWFTQGVSSRRDLLRLGGLNHAAIAVVVRYHDGCGDAVHDPVLNARSSASDTLSIEISRSLPLRSGCGPPEVDRREILVVGSAAEWPSGAEYATSALGVPDAPSNISNSVGFLGGVLTRVVPYESCTILGFTIPAYCRLRYDEFSASLSGTLTNATCDGPVVDAVVALSEVVSEPRIPHKVRQTTSGRTGNYEIGALESGVRYALSIRRLSPPPERADEFRPYVDTLQFAPGEHATLDASLFPYIPC